LPFLLDNLNDIIHLLCHTIISNCQPHKSRPKRAGLITHFFGKKDVVRKAIESYINSPPPQDPEDSRKHEEWQKDLQDLVDEYDQSDRPKGEVWEEGEERNANLPTPKTPDTPDTLCHTPSTPNTSHTRHAPHPSLKKAQFPPPCSNSKIFETGHNNNSDRSPSMENLTHQYRFWFQQPG